jgi:gliding motility-associated-like protein
MAPMRYGATGKRRPQQLLYLSTSHVTLCLSKRFDRLSAREYLGKPNVTSKNKFMKLHKLILWMCAKQGMGQLLCCFILLFGASHIYAQGENNNWCFGDGTGLTFNTVSPSTFPDSTIHQGASVSDAAGNLLFYVSDSTVRDKNQNIMPNGQGLLLDSLSFLHKIIIIQSPTNNNQYYIVFSGNGSTTSKAYYSLVDMTLNNGLGDVVPGQKKIVMATDVGIDMACVPINGGCDGYWIILHDEYFMDYKAFKLSANSLFTDSVISIGLQLGTPMLEPQICVSPDGSRLVRSRRQISFNYYDGSIETASFNTATGMLTNFQYIEPILEWVYHPIFSPDGSKLYAVHNQHLYQYNMALMPNVVAVKNSRTLISNDLLSSSRMGPDGKMYIIRSNGSSPYTPLGLAVINNPNNLAATCGYNTNGVALPAYSQGTYYWFLKLGNPAYVKSVIDTFISLAKDTTICYDQNLTLIAPPDYESPVWSTGSTSAQETFTQPGTYWLQGIQHCTTHIDTFHIHYPNFGVNLGNDTSICEGTTLSLDATLLGSDSYLWQDGSTYATYAVSNEGIYSVSVTKDGCTLLDTISVGMIYPSLNIQEQDTTICKGLRITLQATAFPESNFLWNTGSTTATTVANSIGEYAVTANNICGTFYDSINIQEKICPCIVFVPNAFTPNGDGKNDAFEPGVSCPQISGYTFSIYNRYGQKVFQSSEPGKLWDGSDNGHPADAGTYFFYLQYKDGTNEVKRKGDILLIR